MKSHKMVMSYIRKGLVVVSLMMATTSQAAIFDRLSASPASRDVSTNQLVTLPVTWRIISSHATEGRLDLRSSGQSLVFEDSFGNSLGTVTAKQWLETVPLPQSSRVTTTFSETIVVPQEVIRKARLNRSNRVVIKRVFVGVLYDLSRKPTSITATATGSINLNISTSSTTTELSVSRLLLSFENRLLARIVTRDSTLNAHVELKTHGVGIVRGVWELAEPATTRGTPFFRPIKQVSKHVTGGQSFQLISPSLPTNLDGLYLLRFRLLAPTLGTVPMIRYVVSPSGTSEAVRLLPIDLREPANKAYLKKNTAFAWQWIESAKYYQLEFFISLDQTGLEDREPDITALKRAAGVLVLGKNRNQILSDLTRRHFNSGYHYYWHVIAIDGKGNRIATSELRKIIMP